MNANNARRSEMLTHLLLGAATIVGNMLYPFRQARWKLLGRCHGCGNETEGSKHYCGSCYALDSLMNLSHIMNPTAPKPPYITDRYR